MYIYIEEIHRPLGFTIKQLVHLVEDQQAHKKMRGFSERAPSAVFTATVCILFQQIVKQHFQRVNV